MTVPIFGADPDIGVHRLGMEGIDILLTGNKEKPTSAYRGEFLHHSPDPSCEFRHPQHLEGIEVKDLAEILPVPVILVGFGDYRGIKMVTPNIEFCKITVPFILMKKAIWDHIRDPTLRSKLLIGFPAKTVQPKLKIRTRP